MHKLIYVRRIIPIIKGLDKVNNLPFHYHTIITKGHEITQLRNKIKMLHAPQLFPIETPCNADIIIVRDPDAEF